MKYKSIIVMLCVGGLSILQALPTEPILSTDIALKIAQNALKQCRSEGYNITVNVLDKSGRVLVTLRDEKAGPHTLEGSYKKAFTSASTKIPTSVFAQKLEENKISLGMLNLSKNFIFLSGGLPIKSGNTLIGAIGVSGAPQGALDEKCAAAGIKSVQKDLQ